MNRNIEDIEGIGPKYAEMLKAAGVANAGQLLAEGGEPKGRNQLAERSGINEKLILLSENTGVRGQKPYVINGERYFPISDAQGFVQRGLASWYGKKFHGRPTASGEIFDMNRMSAAHKTLPLGTYVRTVNLKNNKQIVVKINDRGPFVKGRIIDLSYAAAKKIGLIGPGVARVKLTVMGKEVEKLWKAEDYWAICSVP